MDVEFWLSLMLPRVPFLLAYLVGVILAIVFWNRHPPVSLMALLGFLILLVNLFAGVGINVWTLSNPAMPIDQRGMLLQTLSMGRSLLSLVAFGLLITAIFGWRQAGPKYYSLP